MVCPKNPGFPRTNQSYDLGMGIFDSTIKSYSMGSGGGSMAPSHAMIFQASKKAWTRSGIGILKTQGLVLSNISKWLQKCFKNKKVHQFGAY